jgi:hypothetical protein
MNFFEAYTKMLLGHEVQCKEVIGKYRILMTFSKDMKWCPKVQYINQFLFNTWIDEGKKDFIFTTQIAASLSWEESNE